MRSHDQLLLFTRSPHPGQTKTRLIPALGAAGAATLQDEMTRHLVRMCRHATALAATDTFPRLLRTEVRLTGASPAEGRRWLGLPCREQGEGDLTARLSRAFADAFTNKARVAAALGGDCPQLTGKHLHQALQAAAHCGAALIPATDGGYCLLALRRDHAARLSHLFADIAWGSAEVAQQQKDRLRAFGISFEEFPPLSDIDRPEDLSVWQELRQAWYEPPQTLAVIIPTLNEQAQVVPALTRLVATAEIIVVDGTSTDGTPEAVAAFATAHPERNITLLSTAAYRAGQLNIGAAAATADALVFLHADTQLPANFNALVRDTLTDPDTGLGAFSFAFSEHSPSLDLIAAGTRLRNHLTHIPYGDQAFFCRRAFFTSLGAFPAQPDMEDFDFARLARRAARVCILSQRISTSPRRYQSTTPWHQAYKNRAKALHHLITSRQ